MDAMEEIKQTFFSECEDLLEALEEGLQALDDGVADDETLNAVFRAVHSIKGGAGAFALEDLVRFSHKFETTLDEVRQERLASTPELTRSFLRAGDTLADLVRATRDGEDADSAAIDAMIAELAGYCSGAEPADELEKAESEFKPMTLDIGLLAIEPPDEPDSAAPELPQFDIVFRPFAALYANGNEAGLLLRALAELGEISVTCNDSQLPLLDELDAEGAYLEWRIALKTDQGEAEIREIFDFAEGDCVLNITQAPKTIEPIAAPASVDSQTFPSETAPPAPEEDADDDQPDVAASPRNAAGKKTAIAQRATIRVDLERVDRLINLVGELVINQAMVSECVAEAGFPANSPVSAGLEEFKLLTRDIQESVMAIRAQPVKALFQRMSRIVREAMNATGKTVRLVTDGEFTEVDKTVIERLADPLTHMIRNAVDHGLESSDERQKCGKSREGTIKLTAAHRSGRVIIDVIDDGAGIDRKRVKQIAVKKGLIAEDANLTDGEIDNLLFLPGFSTAAAVSDLSGRGVGMDVVKRSIQALGGRISIESAAGVGSTFSISLPLTLAVLDGMVVKVADHTFVAPLSAIVETFKPNLSAISAVADGGDVVCVRGAYVPIVDVGHLLKFRDPVDSYDDKVIILVESSNGLRSALIVDGILDQRQVVIKGLEENYGRIEHIAAATILGDGRIALILDTDSLIAPSHTISHIYEPALALTG